MENGGSEGRLRIILHVVKEEWCHNLILPHEDSPFTSDGVIFNEEIDDDVISDGVSVMRAPAVKGRQRGTLSIIQPSYCRSPGRSGYVLGSERYAFLR